MRQVLPMKPLARAMRYGPSFFGNLKNFVWSDQGAKHSGSAAGPETTSCAFAAGAWANRAVTDAAASSVIARRSVVDVNIRTPSLKNVLRCLRPGRTIDFAPASCLSRQAGP